MRYIESCTHQNRMGVLLELSTPDAMAVRTHEFKELALDLVMQIVAMSPENITGDGVYRPIPTNFAGTACNDCGLSLMDQKWIKTPEVNVRQRIEQVSDVLKVPVKILRFTRFSVED